MAATVMELYGSKVFNEHEMRERLPSSTYKSLKATIEKGQPLDLEVANVVASVMKRWAIEQGAGDGVGGVGRRDEQDLGEVERDLQKMIAEGAVLLAVKRFE